MQQCPKRKRMRSFIVTQKTLLQMPILSLETHSILLDFSSPLRLIS